MDLVASLGAASGTTVVVHVSGDHWADVASFTVAVGTLVLAIATIRLAGKTRDMAEQTARMASEAKRQADASLAQVELTGAALNASTRPWLTLPAVRELTAGGGSRFPSGDGNQPSVTQGEKTISIVVRLENVGNGLALIEPNGIILHPRTIPQHSAATRNGQCDFAVVPTNRNVELTFKIDRQVAQPPWNEIGDIAGADSAYGEFSVEVTYADAAGGQTTRAKVKIASVDPGHTQWRIFEIAYFEGSAAHPSRTSRFVTPDEIDPAESVW